jgi:hypothetical protein
LILLIRLRCYKIFISPIRNSLFSICGGYIGRLRYLQSCCWTVQPFCKRLQVGPQGWSFGLQRKQSDHRDPRLGPHKLARVESVCSLHPHAEEYGIHSTHQKLHCPIPTCNRHAGVDFKNDEQLDTFDASIHKAARISCDAGKGRPKPTELRALGTSHTYGDLQSS